MDVFPKFIIETDAELGDCLIIAKCAYHHQLVTDKTQVKGGGWWRLNLETNTFILNGDSHDFGKAKIEDIKSCIEKGNVFTNKSCMFQIADKHNFSYDMSCEIVELKKL